MVSGPERWTLVVELCLMCMNDRKGWFSCPYIIYWRKAINHAQRSSVLAVARCGRMTAVLILMVYVEFTGVQY